MTNHKNDEARIPNFSMAFQQMASFVAISKTRDFTHTLDELVQQTFIILPQDSFTTPASIGLAIHTLFGIKLADKVIALSIERLKKKENIVVFTGNQMSLSSMLRKDLEMRITDAKRIEEEVKQTWLSQISGQYPHLDSEKLWGALRVYLAQAFRRHGIQTIALLDSTAEVAKEQLGSLSSILHSVIKKEFSEDQHENAYAAVSSFIATVRLDKNRAEYIAQLADGAFNYFSLTIAPEISAKLRTKLNPLTLFLDTNFLFGILNLHVNPQVDVSAELIETIHKFKLPFRLRYHDATSIEISNTIVHFGGELRKQKWPQQISRAAVQSGMFSGAELRYHEKNADESIDVDDFLAPHRHWEILFKDKEINIHRVDSSQERLRSRATLEADYKEFLKKHNREKPYEAIQHDMAVLETVRSMRSNARSTLDAGAILVTCDYYLCRFDWESSREEGNASCVVLPSLLWQILRPFVSESPEFDEAFAETFALPEFALLTRGGAEKAASRMLSILAGYKSIPEETATSMLANELLLNELQSKKTEEEFVKTIESALAKTNVVLLEEKGALERQLSKEKVESEERENKLAATIQTLRQHEEAITCQSIALQEKEDVIRKLTQQDLEKKRQILEAKERERTNKQDMVTLKDQKKVAELNVDITNKFYSFVLAVLVATLFEIIINFVFPWHWLLRHPNSYGLQASLSLLIIFGIIGLAVKSWRRTCWSAGVVSVILGMLQILGGPLITK